MSELKPLHFCVDVTVPSVDDGSMSLYECVANIAKSFNDLASQLDGVLSEIATLKKTIADIAENPAVISVNNATGEITTVIDSDTSDIADLPDATEFHHSGGRIGFAYNMTTGKAVLAVAAGNKYDGYKFYPVVSANEYRSDD